ncbi:hypothetical protein FB451DRAFT_1478318 [Mycena latifolia]|nr:hypothetical protein FB451DRAFT_1478318 [Mycena latifolia]
MPSAETVSLIQADIREANQSQTISVFVRGLQHIESLGLDHINHNAFEHVAHLPALRILKLGAPRVMETTSPTLEPSFMSLQDFELRSTSSQSVLVFIRAMSHSPLLSLVIDIQPAATDASTAAIYAALEQYIQPDSLRCLSVTSSGPSTFLIDQRPIEIEDICHLFHFTNLTGLTLRLSTGLSLDDDAVLAMTKAWLMLDYLALGSRSRADTLRPTLRSLLHIAKRCDVDALELDVDASVVPEIDETVSRQYSLMEWEVANSVLSSPFDVSRFLSGVFPSLDTIHMKMQGAHNPEARVLKERWTEVDAALPICHAMREEERARAQRFCRCRSPEI